MHGSRHLDRRDHGGAGLTRGGFYSYFDSRRSSMRRRSPFRQWQRARRVAAHGIRRPAGRQALARAILDAYLSRSHLDDVEEAVRDWACHRVARSNGPPSGPIAR